MALGDILDICEMCGDTTALWTAIERGDEVMMVCLECSRLSADVGWRICSDG